MSEALNHFALEGKTPRQGQELVIKAAEKAFKTKDTIVLEGPVGSGKSAIAMTLALYYGTSHILTPRKSLQDQYYEDFSDHVCTMKGKGGYPCFPRFNDMPEADAMYIGDGKIQYFPTDPTEDETANQHGRIISDIRNRIPVYHKPEIGCDEGQCVSNVKVKKNCTLADERPCPYNEALSVAQSTDHVIHNVHSFFFQNRFADAFPPRKVMVIDECHDLEGIVRDFIKTQISIKKEDVVDGMPDKTATVVAWVAWFLKTAKVPVSTVNAVYHSDQPDSTIMTELQRYYEERDEWVHREVSSSGAVKVTPTSQHKFAQALSKILDFYGSMDPWEYIVSTVDNKEKGRMEFTFTPITLRGMPEKLFLSYGEKRILMSGTLYNKKVFCRNLGLDPEKVEFISISSEFPAKRRPIFAYKDLMTDNSFASWRDNDDVFYQMIENVKKIMDVYKDKKGLIHAPSYRVAEEMAIALNNHRIITHTPNNFLTVLDDFCGDTESNNVLISPTCQQGVDFKYDIARFQMIIRVPYLNTSDDFIDYMRDKNFAWYNYQSLITFGQMIGRVMRAPDDWGHTYLLDSRFKPYLSRNRDTLQGWLNRAIQYR